MEGFRSKSYKDGMETEPKGMQEFRSYSTNHLGFGKPTKMEKEVKIKKGKSTNGSTSKSWSFNDPELQRKKRVVGYKVYDVEGKMKGSFRKSFRWIKETYSQVVYGWNYQDQIPPTADGKVICICQKFFSRLRGCKMW